MPKRLSPLRTRIGKDIVAEALFPERETGKVAILVAGLPSGPNKNAVLHFLAARGFIAIYPRYRGTWESEGYFLEHSPEKDIQDILRELSKKRFLVDVATGKKKSFRLNAFYLFGASFGGPAVILNADYPRVKKVIALAPVLDWKEEGEEGSFGNLLALLRLGFPGAYRTKRASHWRKLLKNDFYNPLRCLKKIPGEKIFILHAKNDAIVPVEPVLKFSRKTGASFYLKPRGGHLGLSHIMHRFIWKKIETFLSV